MFNISWIDDRIFHFYSFAYLLTSVIETANILHYKVEGEVYPEHLDEN